MSRLLLLPSQFYSNPPLFLKERQHFILNDIEGSPGVVTFYFRENPDLKLSLSFPSWLRD